jgi:hypothetical protein
VEISSGYISGHCNFTNTCPDGDNSSNMIGSCVDSCAYALEKDKIRVIDNKTGIIFIIIF